MSQASTTAEPFARWSTILFALAWLLVMLHGWGARSDGDPTRWLYDPATSAGRMVSRDLERSVLDDSPAAANALDSFLHGLNSDVLSEAISIHRDLIESLGQSIDRSDDAGQRSAQARARLAILWAESGELDLALEVASQIRDRDVSTALELIYRAPTDRNSSHLADHDLIQILADHGLEDWFLERPAIRLLSSRGETQAAQSIARQLAEKRSRLQRRSDWLSSANLLLVVAGIASFGLLVVRARRGGALPRPQGGVPPWSIALGLGVLVRADFWNRFYFLALGEVGIRFPEFQRLAPFYTWGTIIASLPLLWLIHRHLIRPTHGDLRRAFGLETHRLEMAELAAITLAALAVDLLGAYLLAYGASALGFDGHWAEGLDETLIWGNQIELVEVAIDYMVWTPIVEELTFRGLLFYTLRRRLDPLHAAILSAGIFSAVHFYSLPGFLATFWSGLVWALAFERARSLVPGIAAHSIYNFLYVAGIVILYR